MLTKKLFMQIEMTAKFPISETVIVSFYEGHLVYLVVLVDRMRMTRIWSDGSLHKRTYFLLIIFMFLIHEANHSPCR